MHDVVKQSGMFARTIPRRRHEEVGYAAQYDSSTTDVAAGDSRLKLIDQRLTCDHDSCLWPTAGDGCRRRDELCSSRLIRPRDRFECRKIEFRERTRSAEQIALDIIYALGPEQLKLRVCFHALGGNDNFQPPGQGKG